MGTTYRVGFGYGVMIEHDILEKRLPAEVQAALDKEYMGLSELDEVLNAPLLTVETAGNMWGGGDSFVGIFITSTVASDYASIVSSDSHILPTEAELEELNSILTRLGIAYVQRKWWAWSYQG